MLKYLHAIIALSMLCGSAAALDDALLQKHIVQGNAISAVYDAAGNKYVIGNFNGTADFNPGVGVDPVTAGGTGTGYITKFNADGSYAWTKTTGVGTLGSLVIVGSKMYLCGTFFGTNVSVGGVGTVTAGNGISAFVLALSTSDGSPDTTFSTDAVVVFGSAGTGGSVLTPPAIAASGTALYVCGRFGGHVAFPGDAADLSASQISDGFVFAVDFSGAPVTAFGGSKIQFNLIVGDARAVTTGGGRVYVTGVNTQSTTYITSLVETTGAPDGSFGSGGTEIFGTSGIFSASGTALLLSGATLYWGGYFNGANNGFGGTGAISARASSQDCFIAALNAATGAPLPAFNTTGVVTFGGTTSDALSAMAISGTTLFASGNTMGGNFGFNGSGTVNVRDPFDDAFVVALDTTSGAPVTAFSHDGIYTFGGLGGEFGTGLAATIDGKFITVSGSTNSPDAGASSPPSPAGTGFVLDLPVDTGTVDWVVSTTASSGPGSLATAVTLARFGSKITFDPTTFDLRNSDVATVISLSTGLSLLDDNITIDASDRRVTVNGSAATGKDGISIGTSGNSIYGLTIIAFPRNGIRMFGGAKGNVIGGSRATGLGPNGQGLRISSNGIAGININGAGSTSNVIKGCWIGLDSSGLDAKPNLAGILIDGGADSNILGGTAAGEENVISGNEFEGVTVSGAGSDNNVVVGCRVGVAGIRTTAKSLSGSRATETDGGLGRSALGNGSAGVFLSLGTNASKVGGTNGGEGNTIANNGGNGIEVRALESKRNSARGNRITRNVRGGISLFDGANGGIAAPKITAVTRKSTSSGTTTGASTRGLSRVSVSGTSDDGSVEIYNDSGSQGATQVATTTASGGTFSAETDVDDSQNVTATVTDSNGNTSSFTVFTALSGADTDGDGVTDAIESISGTDSSSASSVPTNQGTVVETKGSVAVKFNTTGRDSIGCTATLQLPDGFTLPNAKVGVLFAGIATNITLDEKGKSPKGDGKVTIKGTTLTFTLKNEDLRAALETAGFTNATTEKAGTNVSVTIDVGLNNGTNAYYYTGSATLTYKATANKTGRASLAK